MEKVGQRVGRPAKIAAAIVEVEPVAQRLPLPELVASAHDIEVLIAVSIGIEEHGVDVFVQAVGRKRRLGGATKAAVRTLQPELARLPFGPAEVDVVQAITGDI